VLRRIVVLLYFLSLFGVLGTTLLAAAGAAHAQQRSASARADCEPGFERRAYPHGSELNFRCRTRVIDCPERQGHHATVIPEPSFETAQGVQFGYRCQYTSRDR
jgi:hypothetical protein